MPDTTTTETTEQSPGQPIVTSDVQSTDEEFDRERAMSTIRRLRDTEKADKLQLKELADLKAKVAAHEQEKMTEAEKATAARTAAEKERDEAKAEARRLRTERAI